MLPAPAKESWESSPGSSKGELGKFSRLQQRRAGKVLPPFREEEALPPQSHDTARARAGGRWTAAVRAGSALARRARMLLVWLQYQAPSHARDLTSDLTSDLSSDLTSDSSSMRGRQFDHYARSAI